MVETYSDCRTPTGETIGIIDAVVTLSRLLQERDLSAPEVQKALKDMAANEGFIHLVRECQRVHPPPHLTPDRKTFLGLL